MTQFTNTFPFKQNLTLKYLIDYWKHLANGSGASATLRDYADSIVKQIESDKILNNGSLDISTLKNKQDSLRLLFSDLFPHADYDNGIFAVAMPFGLDFFYETPRFKELGKNLCHDELCPPDKHEEQMHFAYACILEAIYGIEMPPHGAMLHKVTEPATGLAKIIQIELNSRFCRVKFNEKTNFNGKLKEKVMANIDNLEQLVKLLPPEDFTFEGIVSAVGIDVTEQQAISRIKDLLLDSQSIVHSEKFLKLQQEIETLFQRQDLIIYLSALQGDDIYLLNAGHEMDHSCIYHDSSHYKTQDFANTIYEIAYEQQKTIYENDLTKKKTVTEFEKMLLEHGRQSILVSPLKYNNNIVGMLGITSPNKNSFSQYHPTVLKEILPLFAIAVSRSMADFETQVQRLVQDKFTAIHPSVAWRFRKAAIESIEERKTTGHMTKKGILFKDVYPLYAVTDLRGSSTQRHKAIQQDLLTVVQETNKVIMAIKAEFPLPIFDKYLFELNQEADKIKVGLNTGDEIRVMHFIEQQIAAILKPFTENNSSIKHIVNEFSAELNGQSKLFYKHRDAFDQSILTINNTISDYIDQAQYKAQAMFPHYFDKQITDGVDQSIYICADMVENRSFDQIYVKNLRLWQLTTLIEIEQRMQTLYPNLAIPLKTTHLIIAQEAPLNLTFDEDEKRFRVDGAYNIRYEIVKKRIDKVLIKDSKERLTQPEQIAIVYSQPSEAREYRGHIAYLQNQGLLKEKIEDVLLEDLQGIQGLRALRVKI